MDNLETIKYVMRIYLCDFISPDVFKVLDKPLKDLIKDIGVNDNLQLAKDSTACAQLDTLKLSDSIKGVGSGVVGSLILFEMSCVHTFNKKKLKVKKDWPDDWRSLNITELSEAIQL